MDNMNWISVKERLPENDDVVIIYNPKDGIHAGYFDDDQVHSYINEHGEPFYSHTGWNSYYEWAPYMSPTHWMPMPNPPEEFIHKPQNQGELL